MVSLLVVVVAIIAIAVTTALAQKLGVAGPLLLVALGLAVALVPFVTIPPINPEWILVGVLPPLLYAAAVRLPAIEFRRDFGPIAGLSIVLVLVTALVLGGFFWLVVPSVGFPLALGAILSPTDAVATSIVKRLGISPRVVTMLEGESLLNDATALVLLRTALVAVAGSFSFGLGIASFVWGVVLALVVGTIVGLVTLRLRAWMRNPAANTAVGFTVPFLAYLPTEHFGGSGLVAAVVAGIVTGQGATRWFTPEERLSEHLNWRTVELVLEGAVFLVMGLELRDIVTRNLAEHGGLWQGAWLALSALGIVLVVRSAFVALLVRRQSKRARGATRERIEAFGSRIDAVAAHPADAAETTSRASVRPTPQQRDRRVAWGRARVTRALADFDYYQSSPLGWRHGTIIVWAGMRGVVTLAAAQTLPRDGIQDRALLVFVAFLVALISLMLQGFTLPWLVRMLGMQGSGAEALSHEELTRLDAELRQAAASALSDPELVRRDGMPFSAGVVERAGARFGRPPDEDASATAREALELRLTVVEAMRNRLIDLAVGGVYSTAVLRHSLAELDADQLSLELRLDDEE